jgi:hypothetical protein
VKGIVAVSCVAKIPLRVELEWGFEISLLVIYGISIDRYDGLDTNQISTSCFHEGKGLTFSGTNLPDITRPPFATTLGNPIGAGG